MYPSENDERRAPLLEQRAGGEELQGESEEVKREEGAQFDAAWRAVASMRSPSRCGRTSELASPEFAG